MARIVLALGTLPSMKARSSNPVPISRLTISCFGAVDFLCLYFDTSPDILVHLLVCVLSRARPVHARSGGYRTVRTRYALRSARHVPCAANRERAPRVCVTPRTPAAPQRSRSCCFGWLAGAVLAGCLVSPTRAFDRARLGWRQAADVLVRACGSSYLAASG